MILGHGIEVSDWLVASMTNGIAMKLWNLNLGIIWFPGQCLANLGCGHGHALTRNTPCGGFVRLFFTIFLTCLRSVPHCVPNKAHAQTGTHTLPTTQLQFQVSSWKYVWCLHVWQCAYSQITFMCDHGVLMPHLHF